MGVAELSELESFYRHISGSVVTPGHCHQSGGNSKILYCLSWSRTAGTTTEWTDPVTPIAGEGKLLWMILLCARYEIVPNYPPICCIQTVEGKEKYLWQFVLLLSRQSFASYHHDKFTTQPLHQSCSGTLQFYHEDKESLQRLDYYSPHVTEAPLSSTPDNTFFKRQIRQLVDGSKGSRRFYLPLWDG